MLGRIDRNFFLIPKADPDEKSWLDWKVTLKKSGFWEAAQWTASQSDSGLSYQDTRASNVNF